MRKAKSPAAPTIPSPRIPTVDGPRPLRVSRGLVLSGLFFLFAGAYLFTPYWELAKSPANQLLLAILTGAAALAWALLASGPLELRPSWKGALWFLAALAIVGALNCRAIFGDLLWRGDEDHHFKATLMLAKVLTDHWRILLILLIPAAVAAVLQWRGAQSKWCIRSVLPAAAASGAAVVIAVALARPPFAMDLVARYPLATNWLAAPWVAIAQAASRQSNPPEAVFRIVPFLSAVLLAWVCARKAEGLGLIARVVYMLVVGSIPSILYYSSILYLEMPAILLMTAVCLGAEEVVTCPAGDLGRKPQWYALILTGFIKDNVPTFLGAVIVARLWFRLREGRKARSPGKELLAEIGTAFCVGLPYVTFWFYRSFVAVAPRGYTPFPSGLFDLEAWATVLWALLNQYTAAAISFPLAIAFLRRKGKNATAMVLVLGFAFYMALHLMDRGGLQLPGRSDVTGFSRYLLIFAPILVVSLHEVVKTLAAKLPRSAPLVLAALAGLNLLLCPIHPDGARQSGWGEYVYHYTEHSYPYREALGYVMERHSGEKTLVTGFDYQYWNEFYTGRTDRFARRVIPRVPDETEAVQELLGMAARDGFQHVLYHVMGPSEPRPKVAYGFTQERVFRNSSHTLVLYSLGRK